MAAVIRIDHTLTQAASGRAGQARFCSRCGEPGELSERGERPATHRVCQACGMGMMLSCLREALPGAGAAFLIATADLRITAASESAEVLFGPEEELLGQFLGNVVASPAGEEHLARIAARAALRNREPVALAVRGLRARSRQAGMLAARISTCGPPRAALVTVEPSGFAPR